MFRKIRVETLKQSSRSRTPRDPIAAYVGIGSLIAKFLAWFALLAIIIAGALFYTSLYAIEIGSSVIAHHRIAKNPPR